MTARLQLLLPEGVADASFSSTALVSLATARELRMAWGSFVELGFGASAPRVFRVAVDDAQPPRSIHIDHWPSGENDGAAPTTGAAVSVQCLDPTVVRSVQYVELVPASEDQPRLASAFIKSMLRDRVLSPLAGCIAFQLDGLGYGSWRYRAFCRGETGAGDVNAGVVNDSTMMLVFPSASGRLSDDTADAAERLQPIGAHAQKFRELVAITLSGDRDQLPRQHKGIASPRNGVRPSLVSETMS